MHFIRHRFLLKNFSYTSKRSLLTTCTVKMSYKQYSLIRDRKLSHYYPKLTTTLVFFANVTILSSLIISLKAVKSVVIIASTIYLPSTYIAMRLMTTTRYVWVCTHYTFFIRHERNCSIEDILFACYIVVQKFTSAFYFCYVCECGFFLPFYLSLNVSYTYLRYVCMLSGFVWIQEHQKERIDTV